jgi:hypothetical protein
MTCEKIPSIGEIQINAGEDKMTVNCHFECASKLSLIVQDCLGRPIINKDFEVDETTDSLSFHISNCSPGKYHAWIFNDAEIAIRQFNIEQEKGAHHTAIRKFASIFLFWL